MKWYEDPWNIIIGLFVVGLICAVGFAFFTSYNGLNGGWEKQCIDRGFDGITDINLVGANCYTNLQDRVCKVSVGSANIYSNMACGEKPKNKCERECINACENYQSFEKPVDVLR